MGIDVKDIVADLCFMAGTVKDDEKLQTTLAAAISALESQGEENAQLEAERDALKGENERLRGALENVTDLLIVSWAGKREGNPEDEVAVRYARAALLPT